MSGGEGVHPEFIEQSGDPGNGMPSRHEGWEQRVPQFWPRMRSKC